MRKIVIPAVDTEIPFTLADVHRPRKIENGSVVIGTPHIRITFDEATDTWKTIPVGPRRGGLIVFLNDTPTAEDTHVRITSVIGTGKGSYGDPIRK
jgi:hypothetical protein